MEFDIVVIGGGQAGLSIGYYLKKADISFVILSKDQMVGDVWKYRYDSLKLFTSRYYSSLPGLNMKGDQNGFPTKNEIAMYLEKYVETFSLPIRLGTEVLSLKKMDEIFLLNTNKGIFTAKKVIVATGPFQTPLIPKFAQNVNPDVMQLHSSEYKNPNQLKKGKVLVVGGGNSGAQIAVELSKTHETYLSVGHKLKFLPLTIMKKNIFWWFNRLGFLRVSNDSKLGRWMQRNGDPIFGFDLKQAIRSNKVELKPRTINVDHHNLLFEDGSKISVNNIIWSTGFKSDYGWIDIEEAFHSDGKPIHHRGISNIKNLYFLGLPWLYRRGSALLLGVGEDAQYIFQQINNSEK